MIYKGCLISHGGKVRQNNEDNGFLDGAWRSNDKKFAWKYGCEKKDNLLCGVFDGVGGEDCGEVASRLAAEALFSFNETGFQKDGFDLYVLKANEQILSAPESSRMASTFVILSIENNQYYFCNMGDSRAYLFRKGKLIQISKDHNMVRQLVEEGILTPEQAVGHPDLHTIYQYLGMKSGTGEEELILEPYCLEAIPSKDGDICLLCTDGLTDMVEDEDIAQILSENQDIEEKTKCLLESALEHGGRDNITVLLVEAKCL